MMADPRRIRPRVLLTSVFGPFAEDDEFGSRAINPLELYHNQITRAQGPFSLRMHHRSWGIMLIQANIAAIPGLERMLDADHIVKGEGIKWFRELLGEPVDAPITHPPIASSFGFR